MTIYKPLIIQTKGWEMLKELNTLPINQKDSLVSDITQVYTIFIELLKKSNDHLEIEVLNNLESFKKYPWFVNWTEASFDEEMIIYYTESEEFRKKVAAHNILAANNHLQLVNAYKLNAIEILRKINERLNVK